MEELLAFEQRALKRAKKLGYSEVEVKIGVGKHGYSYEVLFRGYKLPCLYGEGNSEAEAIKDACLDTSMFVNERVFELQDLLRKQ